MGSKTRTERRVKALRDNGGICSSCGTPVPSQGPLKCSSCENTSFLLPDEPGWTQVKLKWSARQIKQSPRQFPLHPPNPQTSRQKKAKPKDFDVESWTASIINNHRLWGLSLRFVGDSRLVGAKAGKRKGLRSYAFVVDPAEPLPFDEPTQMLWHGTPFNNAGSILENGLLPSTRGMLGPGVYLGELAKARRFASGTHWGLLLHVEAALGNIENASPEGVSFTTDTAFAEKGLNSLAWSGYLRHREWCVKDPRRVAVRELHVIELRR